MQALSFIFILLFGLSISAQSPSVRLSFDEGTRLAKAGDFEKALLNYRAASAASKTERVDQAFLARLHYNLGVCEYRLDRPDAAIRELEIAIRRGGGNYPAAQYARGMAETARENWPRARIAFNRSLEGNNANGEAWFDLAFAYLGERDLKNAELAFRKSIAHRSVDAPLGHNNLGVLLALRGEMAAAKKEFTAALRTSAGRLKIAESNLRFCERYERTGELVASSFEITRRNSQ